MNEVVSTQGLSADCSLVGNEPWTFTKITDILNNSGSSETLWNNLSVLARHLEIPADKGCCLKRRLSNDTAIPTEILYEVLEAWRMKAAGEASIYRFIRVLEKIGLNDSADALRNEMSQDQKNQSKLLLFKDDIIDTTTWDNLSEALKLDIGENHINYQNKTIKLNQLGQGVDKYLDGKTLKSLAFDQVPVLVNNQVPNQLQYYINRKVKSRHILKPNLLKAKCYDVFIIQGIERYQLTSLVPNSDTDVSRNQIEKLTVRFIQLDCETDYEKICSLTDEPVHWILYRSERFEWIKSNGCVKTLQAHIHEEQYSEDEVELDKKTGKATVISDSPGMGKTNLVVNLAHKIINRDPKILVRFIVLQDFLWKLHNQFRLKEEIPLDSILSLIARESSNNPLFQNFVRHILQSQPCVIIFDGFDEVPTDQLKAAKEVLQAITTLNSVRIYVTTRPHRRNELECALHVLGYTIQQFTESDQKSFLTTYWSSIGITINESVRAFADECISEISTKMNDFDKTIAGIPLQCRLIAETYKAYAHHCSTTGHPTSHPVQLANSMFEMYERYIENLFEKICPDEGSKNCWKKSMCNLRKKNPLIEIKRAHMYYALKSLFPEHVSKLPCFSHLNNSNLLFKDLCSMGILEATDSENIRFVHRTFAEFFIAWFVVECDGNPFTVDFILSQVFSTTDATDYFQFPCLGGYSCKTFKFNFPVICYFINGFARKRGTVPLELRNEPSLNPLNSEFTDQLIPILFASVVNDYPYVPAVASEKLFPGSDIQAIQYTYISTILLILSKHAGLQTIKIFCDDKDVTQLPFIGVMPPSCKPFKITPVHVAVQRGDYNLVVYFIRKYDKQLLNLSYLLHICVHATKNDDGAKIEEKKQIIKLLSKSSKQWINERFYGITPLMQYSVNLELLESLIEEGADVNITDRDGKTLYEKLIDEQQFQRCTNPSVYNRLICLIEKYNEDNMMLSLM